MVLVVWQQALTGRADIDGGKTVGRRVRVTRRMTTTAMAAATTTAMTRTAMGAGFGNSGVERARRWAPRLGQ